MKVQTHRIGFLIRSRLFIAAQICVPKQGSEFITSRCINYRVEGWKMFDTDERLCLPPVAATPAVWARLQSRGARWITLAYNLFISAGVSGRWSCKAASSNIVVALWCGFIKSLFSILFIFSHSNLNGAMLDLFPSYVDSNTAVASSDSNQVLALCQSRYNYLFNPPSLRFLQFEAARGNLEDLCKWHREQSPSLTSLRKDKILQRENEKIID